MTILDRLPYHDRPSLLSFGPHAVQIRSHQIVVWASIARRVFPAVLDTGHSHNFTILERHLREWAGVDVLEQIGDIEVNRRKMPQYAADVRLHGNRPGTREPVGRAYRLEMSEGITVVPEGTPTDLRLPLIGLRAITRNGLKLVIDGARRRVTLKTAGWF